MLTYNNKSLNICQPISWLTKDQKNCCFYFYFILERGLGADSHYKWLSHLHAHLKKRFCPTPQKKKKKNRIWTNSNILFVNFVLFIFKSKESKIQPKWWKNKTFAYWSFPNLHFVLVLVLLETSPQELLLKCSHVRNSCVLTETVPGAQSERNLAT